MRCFNVFTRARDNGKSTIRIKGMCGTLMLGAKGGGSCGNADDLASKRGRRVDAARS